MKMHLEDLCNELLLEIFEYIDVYQLYVSFYGFNRRFTSLIQQCHLHICLKYEKNDSKIWDLIASTIDFSKVYEMSLYSNSYNDRRFYISKCPNLRILTLTKMNGFFVQVVLDDIPAINKIQNFRIEYPKSLCCPDQLSTKDFSLKKYHRQLASITSCLLELPINPYQNPDVPVIFSKLHRLSLDENYWKPNVIEFIQNNTPNLRILHIRTTNIYTSFQEGFRVYVLNHIIELNMNLHLYSLNLEYLGKMFPNIRRLHFEWDIFRKFPFIDGNQWQKVFERQWSLTHYLSFDFRHAQVDEKYMNTFYKNRYWLAKNIQPILWNFKSELKPVCDLKFVF